MRILKLKLRGAIGIKKGLGVDEVEIDFTQFQPGLIALTGRNGSGKTTVMENLHPYRTMVSRDGSLQSHFFLKDSYRILEFEFAGHQYLSKILIDALTGGSEAYLLRDTDKGFNPLNDGKLTTYDEAIEKLLGTPELFFNSVFSGQKSKGIAELKPADRRKLFYELLNLDHYETYLERAKRELRDQEFKLAKIEGELSAINDQQSDTIENLEKERIQVLEKQKSLTDEIFKIESDLDQTNELIKEFEIEIRTSEEKLKGNEEIEKHIAAISEEIQTAGREHNSKIFRYNSDLQDFQKIITNNGFLLKHKDKISTALVTLDNFEKSVAELKDRKSLLLERNGIIQKEYSEASQHLNGMQSDLDKLVKQSDTLFVELKALDKDLADYEKQTSLISEVPCDQHIGESCQFLKNAFTSKGKIDDCRDKRIKFSDEKAKLNEIIEAKSKELGEEKTRVEERYRNAQQEIESFGEIDRELTKQKKQLDEFLSRNYKQQAEQLLKAEHEIELYQQKYDNTVKLIEESKAAIDREIKRREAETGDLRKRLDLELPKKINAAQENLSRERMTAQSLGTKKTIRLENMDELKQEFAKIDQQIETVNQNKERIAALNEEKAKVENEIRDWTFLCKAFDKTGIPVLKLENSGVEITTIANELLSLFENKFRIVFETTSLTKDKKKMKETFDINIVEEDGVCEIGNKSGGQQVWLETAIQLSIMILLSQQGKKAETAFLDEKDGALDLDNAYAYIEMIKKAHEMSGVYNTFIITHRTELLDFIPQQVKLNNGILQVMN